MNLLNRQSIVEAEVTSRMKFTNFLQSSFERLTSFISAAAGEETQHTGIETQNLNNTTTLTSTFSHFAFIEKVCERAIRNIQQTRSHSNTKDMDTEQCETLSDNEEDTISSGEETGKETYYFTTCERPDEKHNMLETRHIEVLTTTVDVRGTKATEFNRNWFGNGDANIFGRERRCNTIGYGRSLSDPMFEKSSVYKQSNKSGLLPNSVMSTQIESPKCTFMNNTECKQENVHHQGTMKLSMQYFENTNQLRVIALTAEDVKSSNGKIKAVVSLHCPTAVYSESSRKTVLHGGKAQFNDNFYFDTINDDLADYIIKIKLKKTRQLLRSRTIGEITISLGDLTLKMDTTLVAPVFKKQKSKKVTLDAKDIQVSSLKSSIQEDILAKLEVTETMQLRSSLKRVRSLPVMKRHGTILL